MNYTIGNYLATIAFVLFQQICYSQTIINQSLKNSIVENFIFNECIELETDHSSYLSGESIEFSCITLDYILQVPIKISKIAYVEFFTFDNNIISQSKTELKNSCGNGKINIPKELPTGVYYIRAYTNYMKNFSVKDYTLISLEIINPLIPQNNNSLKSSINTNEFSCTLYPEGGNIIYNRNNKITCVFKGNNLAPAIGVITDQSDSIITKFNTNGLGIAGTKFFPKNGKKYYIKAINSERIKINQEIKIENSAISISITEINDQAVKFKIKSVNYDNFPLNLNAVYKNAIIKLLSISKDDTVVEINRNKIPNGIINFQLVKLNEIVSHLWLNNLRSISNPVNIKLNKQDYKTREEVSIELENLTKDTNLFYIFSVIGIDRDSEQLFKNQTSNLSLKRELYSKISRLGIPLNSIIDDSLLLDKVLLTINKNSYPYSSRNSLYHKMKFIPELNEDIIHGKINKVENNSLSKSLILQANIDSIPDIQITYTDSLGNFYFPINNGNNNHDISFTTNNNNNQLLTVDDEFSQDFISLTQEKFYINKTMRNNIQQRFVNMQILDLYKIDESKSNIKKQPFYIEPNKVLFINEYPQFKNFEQFVFEVLPWVTINKINKQKTILVSYKGTDKIIGNHPLYLVDGIPVFNINLILNLECKYLKSASVVYEKVFFQNMYFDGIIDIKTIEGNASVLSNNNNLIKMNFIGTSKDNNKPNEAPDQHSPSFKTKVLFTGFKRLQSTNKESLFVPDYSSSFFIKCCVLKPDGSKINLYKTFNVSNE